MLCSQCKAELPDGSQFCLKCGHALKVSAPKIASPMKSLGWIGLGVAIATIAFFAWRVAMTRSASPQLDMAQASPTVQPRTSPAASIPRPRVLSAKDIFQMANSSMALIETFDDEGHKLEQGSGFVVSSDGATITNYHVIRGATRATTKFGDGSSSDVTGVVAFDESHDVAVLKLASPPQSALHIGDSDGVQVGQKIIAIGSPLGLQNTVSEGIVSGLRNGIIQMSDPISPGSSGGAVFDSYGNVIGISVATVTAGQNLNFAVPIKWAKPYLNAGNPRTFADVIAENTVTNDALDGSLTVPARQSKNWTFILNPNAMSDAKVQGQVSSTGGVGGNITLALYLLGQTQPIYFCRETNCSIDQKLVARGSYVLKLDNTESALFARTVTGKLSLTYVK